MICNLNTHSRGVRNFVLSVVLRNMLFELTQAESLVFKLQCFQIFLEDWGSYSDVFLLSKLVLLLDDIFDICVLLMLLVALLNKDKVADALVLSELFLSKPVLGD